MYKILGSESPGNSTPSAYSNNRVVRIAHTGTRAETITLWDNTLALDVAVVDTDINSTNVIVLTTGDTTPLAEQMRIMGSSNVEVINSVVASKISTIVNSSAFTSNVDIVIANGSCQLYVTDSSKTFTMVPNTEFVIEKARTDFLSSTNNATINVVPVSYRG